MRQWILLTATIVFLYGNSVLPADEVLRVADEITVDPNDWPWWRGPNRNGIAKSTPKPPIRWSDTENVIWKTAIAGKGHGSPIVLGNQVFLQTSDDAAETQSVLCLDRKTGEQRWAKTVHKGGFPGGLHEKSSSANSTPATDGERIFVNFMNHGAVFTTALDRQGNQLWQKKVSIFQIQHGFSSSPSVYQGLVIVSADTKGRGQAVALDRKTGEFVWKRARPYVANHASPVLLNADHRDQLILVGSGFLSSVNPLTGKTLWELKGSTNECVASPITDGKHIFSSGGYPRSYVSATSADGSKQIVWENSSKVYVPSMILNDGYLYATLDAGVAMCWEAETGVERWKHRIGGIFSSSLVIVGDTIYATDESGNTTLFAADPAKFQLIAENHLGQEVFATPAICGGQIFHRVAFISNGQRQEFLYCIAASGST